MGNRNRRAARPASGFPISHRYHTTSINVKSRLYYAEYLQLSPFSFQHSASSPRPDRSFCLLLRFLPLFPRFSILTFVIRIGNLCYFRLFLVIMHKSSSELEKRRYLLENDEKIIFTFENRYGSIVFVKGWAFLDFFRKMSAFSIRKDKDLYFSILTKRTAFLRAVLGSK